MWRLWTAFVYVCVSELFASLSLQSVGELYMYCVLTEAVHRDAKDNTC